MRIVPLCTLLVGLALAPAARAQAPTSPPPARAAADAGDLAALKAQIAKQQKQLEAQHRQLEALQQAQSARAKKTDQVAKQVQRMKEKREAEELKKLSDSQRKAFKPSFRLFGFTDFNFVKRWSTDNDSIGRLIISEPATFYMLSANLYAVSHITRNLSAMMELKFTYQPQGTIKDYEVYFKNGSQVTFVDGTKYVRANTTEYSPFDSTRYRRGGLAIERLHIDYQVADWLKFTVGRFLTPYGIWNIDHGSPVVLPASVPYMQRSQIVPQAQTGIQVAGRLFFTDRLSFDYAVTVSNGRNAMDEVSDVDNHFAYGVRLRLAYDSPKLKAKLGAYGYYGRLKDKKESVLVDLQTGEALTRFDVLENLDEYIYSLDLLLEFYGVRIQAEYAYRFNHYLSPSERDTSTMSQAITGVGNGTTADYYTHGAYVLIAYTLPLRKWLGDMKLTPFASYEFNNAYDYRDATTMITAGVNFRPLPALVIKAQWEGLLSSRLGDFHSAIVQMAVAF